jgi:hypothetical protein
MTIYLTAFDYFSETVRIGECPSNSPFLENNGAEAHWF